MHYETALLNAICDNQDIVPVIENGADAIFQEHKDIWTWVSEFYYKYGKVPSKSVVKDNFPTFDLLDTSAAPLEYYIDDAKKHALSKNVRAAIARGIEILQENGPNAALNFISSQSFSIMKDVGGLKDTNLVGDYKERIEEFRKRYEDPDFHIAGIPSYIGPIDKIWGGWQNGDFVVVMGIPGCGKTWLSRLFALNGWKAGFSPLIISLEMSKEQEGYRLDTILNEGELFTGADLLNGSNISPDKYADWAKEQFEGKPPIHLVTAEGLQTANQNMVQAKIDQYRPDMVVVDYVNIMEDAAGGGTETDRIRNIFKALKRIAVKNNIPVIAISAVTMKEDSYGERAPQLNELAWSKHAAHDCDLVLAVHRSENSNIFEIVSRKARRSETFAFMLDWNLNTGKWKELYV